MSNMQYEMGLGGSAGHEKTKYLEDVPNYQEKLLKYKLAEYAKEAVKNHELFEYHEDVVKAKVALINAEYGAGAATYKQAKDLRDRFGFRIDINYSYRSEFEDILDEHGNLLNSRTR